jgi:hypothetical protein
VFFVSKIFWGKLLLVCWLILEGGAFSLEAFQNEPQGFRGASWWSGIHGFSRLYLFEKDGSWELYRREGESLLFGEAQLDDVLYYFVNQHFAGVFLGTYGQANRDLLLREASRRWGPGKPLIFEKNLYGYTWYGRSVAAHLHYDPLTEESRLVITPFFSRDSLGREIGDLQRDFAVLVRGKNPLMRNTPFRKEIPLFAPGGDRYPKW